MSHQRQLVALIERSENKRAACRQAGIHHSTFYRWRARLRTDPRIEVPRRRWRDLRIDSQVVDLPVLSRYLEPSITGLRRDLDDYLAYYNWERRHSGKWNRGRTPVFIIRPKEKLTS